MIRICVAGVFGRMGRRILELAAAADDIEISGAFEVPPLAGRELVVGAESRHHQSIKVSANPAAEIARSDVLIDFTAPEASVNNVRTAAELGKAAVVGTTGLSEAQKAALSACAEKIAVVYAPNMSVGVNLLFKLTGEVARLLGLDYNVEIVEIHHNQKKDSPSGTAARLAECAAEALGLDAEVDVSHGREGLLGPRPTRQIGMHALRGGDVVGEHSVAFIGHGERIELTHKAHSRDNFALGALRAVRYVVTAKPGLYDMQGVLGLR
ncbi:MAG: 4-hydroxy-tetrahydrodipicolinate reductase [Candidatus Hydrogenedentes bacterium]|nr:4-hydroxy-tetrahydrodipicolinate reductase [Candidatus Hydrogenedentota bacterium]